MVKIDDIKYGAMISNQGVHPQATLSKKDFDWLIEQAEKAEKHEKTLNRIAETSGKSMIHNFSIGGHEAAVYMAEVALDFDEE